MKFINCYCHTDLQPLNYYLQLNDTIVYVLDLKHKAPQLINEAEQLGFKVYSGAAKRMTKKQHTIKTITFGTSAPTTISITLDDKCVLRDYSWFDKRENLTAEQMKPIVDLLIQYNHPTTGCKIIEQMLKPSYANLPNTFNAAEEESYDMLCMAMRGGANCVLNYDLINYETHVDYHQLYAYVMTTNTFPALNPVLVDGFMPHPFGIYRIIGGKAQLHKDGYALLSNSNSNIMFGADGKIHDLTELGAICHPDLQLLYQNYDIYDLEIAETLYYPFTFDGKTAFSDAVHTIYNGRKRNDETKSFYKLLNEYMAGYFERSLQVGSYWLGSKRLNDIPTTTAKYNPKVGIFITAYGRQLLNKILHTVPKSQVVGYDTDCIFLNCKKDDVSPKLLKSFGDMPGQLHFDGIYKDVIHKASKSYNGYDLETNAPFRKQSGIAKSGYCWYYNGRTYEKRKSGAKENEKSW